MKELLQKLDGRVSGIESDIKKIYYKLADIEKRLPNITEAEVREIKRQLDEIIKWAHKVSKKYDIPLPRL